jgi:uncharacterized protein involved in cysteine biosynthesis
MNYLVEGARLVYRERELWTYVWRPLLLSSLIFIAIVALGLVYIVPQLAALGERFGLGDFAGTAALVAYGIFWWFASGVVFVAISSLFSSFLWDRLSLRVEQIARGGGPEAKLGCSTSAADSAMRLMFSMFICFGTVLCGWFFFLGILFAGWLALYDFTASAFLRRGVLFPRQASLAFRCKGSGGFLVGCGLLTILPFVNVLMFPAMVAGGTLMCRDTYGVEPIRSE